MTSRVCKLMIIGYETRIIGYVYTNRIAIDSTGAVS